MQRKSREKLSLQRELTQFDDELRRYYERKDGEPFDRQDRLAILENQKETINSNSIFGAIFQELKNKSKNKNHRKFI